MSHKKRDAGALGNAVLLRLRRTSSSPQPVMKETDVPARRPRGQAAMFDHRSPTLADTLVDLIPLCPAVCLLVVQLCVASSKSQEAAVPPAVFHMCRREKEVDTGEERERAEINLV